MTVTQSTFLKMFTTQYRACLQRCSRHFAAGNRIVNSRRKNSEDVEKAAVCTAYTDYVCSEQNDGYSVLSSVISDALLARVGIAKVFWQQSEEIDQQEFDNLSQDELDMLLAEEDVELIDSETDEIGLVSGTIAITRDTSQVVIEPVAPEEFLIEQQAKVDDGREILRASDQEDAV